MEESRTNFVAWLRNAHAVEQQALTMLNAQAERLEHYPDLRAGIQRHIQETEQQALQLAELLTRYDTGASTMKDMAAKLMASMQAFGGMFAGDEVIKGAQMGYVFEHLEIASHTILIAAARSMGDTSAERVLSSILEQEISMADWMAASLPDLTQAYLSRAEAGLDAQR